MPDTPQVLFLYFELHLVPDIPILMFHTHLKLSMSQTKLTTFPSVHVLPRYFVENPILPFTQP